MNVLLYALCCLLLPLWIFSGLYLLIEIVVDLKKRYIKSQSNRQ
jgi:hypothetical protein